MAQGQAKGDTGALLWGVIPAGGLECRANDGCAHHYSGVHRAGVGSTVSERARFSIFPNFSKNAPRHDSCAPHNCVSPIRVCGLGEVRVVTWEIGATPALNF